MHVELSRQTIRKLTFFGGLLGLLGSLFLSLLVGTVTVSPVELWQFLMSSPLANTGEFIYRLRVPRALNAALTGMNLALSGCILQGLVRNPLADPGIIGISAGAGMAAMLLMFLAPNLVFWVPIVAFIGAMGAAVLVFALAWNRGVQPLFLVLSGVAVSVFFGGGMTALSVFFSDQVQGTIGWMAGGGLSTTALTSFARQLPITIAFIAILLTGCAAMAWVLHAWLGVSYLDAYLATTPGGLETVLALAGEASSGPVVASVQIIRLLFVLIIAGWLPQLIHTLLSLAHKPH